MEAQPPAPDAGIVPDFDGPCPPGMALVEGGVVTEKQRKRWQELYPERLPTLVEWLWAAGGGAEDRKYPWGNARPTVKRLNGCDFACARNQQSDCDEHDIKTGSCVMREMVDVQGEDGFDRRAPVGSFPAGAGRWGHLDLVGNMSELVVDRDHILDCGSNYYGEEMSLHSEACHRAPYVDSRFMGARCARAADVTRRP